MQDIVLSRHNRQTSQTKSASSDMPQSTPHPRPHKPHVPLIPLCLRYCKRRGAGCFRAASRTMDTKPYKAQRPQAQAIFRRMRKIAVSEGTPRTTPFRNVLIYQTAGSMVSKVPVYKAALMSAVDGSSPGSYSSSTDSHSSSCHSGPGRRVISS